MSAWYLDEGLATFRRQWWALHPGATIYTIGDSAHSGNPDVSQHAPDRGGSQPGDSRGEVDAVDVMPGKGVTQHDLGQLFDDLVESRDPRILYVIYDRTIVSSVTQPWKRRTYGGTRHMHVHLSVNDRYEANTSTWKIGDKPAMPAPARERFEVELPVLAFGYEDPSPAEDGRYQHVWRLQVMLNAFSTGLPKLDTDGVYGAKTVQMAGKVFGTNGRRVTEDEWRKLYGLYVPKK